MENKEQGVMVMADGQQQPIATRQIADAPSGNRRFDIASIAAAFPETAKTLLIDEYLTNRPEASARVFRVYRPTPPHYHATCDEYLYVFSGRGTFWMKDASTKATFEPGQLLFFERGTVHAMPELFDHPVVLLSIDTPRREPTDIIFVDPKDGTPETFMARNAGAT
jgi:mannose-6-phosphate isomerase-like protein (cupin superfamily)